MPKASVHQNGLSKAWKHEVGLARQILPMQSKPVSEPVRRPPYGELRRRVLLPHLSHESRAVGARQSIRHRSVLDQYRSQNSTDRLRLGWFRIRLLRDPLVQRCLDVRVEAQPDLRSDAGARPTTLISLTLGYCAHPRLVVPETSEANRSKAGTSLRL